MRVYISSPFLDLKGCRSKAYDALRRIGVDAIGMEDYVASDDRPVDKCLGDVRRCDAYVGLLAWRYGYVPDDAACSVTELEYRTAVSEHIPQLLFLLHPDAPWPRANVDRDPARIDTLRGEWEKNRIVSHFQTCDELGALVTAAVARRLLEERETEGTRPTHSEDEERRALQLQLDEIKRQLQFLTARIGAAEITGEHEAAAGAISTDAPPSERSSGSEALPTPPSPPQPSPAAPAEARPSHRRAAELRIPGTVRAASKRSPRVWAAGGTALVLAASLFLAIRTAPLQLGGPQSGEDPSTIVAAPPQADSATLPSTTPLTPANPITDSARLDSARLDTVRPDTVVQGRVTSNAWVPPFWITTGIVAVFLLGAALFTLRRPTRSRSSRVPEDYEPHWPPPYTPIAPRPKRPSSAPPLTELADRNRQFLDETQQKVEQRLQALGEPPAA